MDKLFEDIMRENGDGNFFTDVAVKPGSSTTNLQLNVRGTETEGTFNSDIEQNFFQDFSDYYKQAGGNQTAQGVVDRLANPFIYPAEEGFKPFESESYKSQDNEFKKKYLTALSGTRSEQHLTDTLIRLQEQERIEKRLLDPNYDANNIAAVSGAIFGGVFDVTSAVPLRAVYSAKKLTQAYKLAKIGKRGSETAQQFTKHAKLLDAVSTTSQFAAAEAVREIVGDTRWERSNEEVIANVAAAALFGAGVHGLVTHGAAKSLGHYQAQTMLSTTDDMIANATKLDFIPGDKVATPEGWRGKAFDSWNSFVSTIKPGVAMATSSIDEIRQTIFKLDGTAYDTVNGGTSAPISQQLATDQSIFLSRIRSFRGDEYFGSYVSRGGTLSEADFAKEINNVSFANSGKTLDEFVSSGIDEVDNFYKNVYRAENKKLLERLQSQGEFLGIDLEKGYHHRLLDEGTLLAQPNQSKQAIARAMRSSDVKARERFIDMETQLKSFGLKISRTGRLTAKAIKAFKEANEGNEKLTKTLEDYLEFAEKSVKNKEELFDFRKAAPRVRNDYSKAAEDLYNKALAGDEGSFYPVKSSGNIKKSGNRLDWEELKDYMVNDFEGHAIRSHKSLNRRSRMIQYFGDPTGNEQKKLINAGVARERALAQQIKDPVKRQKRILQIEKEGAAGLESFDGILNRLFEKKSTGIKAHGWLDVMIKGMKSLTSTALLAKGVISQIGDMVQFVSHQMTINWNRIAPGVKSVTNKAELGLDTNTFKKFNIESVDGFDSRARAMHGSDIEVTDSFDPTKNSLGFSLRDVANFFDWYSEKAFKYNGMTWMNNAVRGKSAGDMLVSTVNLAKLAHEGKLDRNADYGQLLKDLNLTDTKLKAIWRQYSKNPNINSWDEELTSQLMAKIRQYNNNKIIIEPGISDKPFLFDQQAAQPFALFKGFLVASLDKFIGRDIQEGPRGLNRMIGRLMMGTLLYIAKSSMTQTGTNWDPKALVLEGIYQSGNFPVVDMVAQFMDQAFDAGPERLFGIEDVGRKYFKGSTTMLETLVGPSATVFKDIERIASKAAGGDLTMRDALTMSKYHYALAPFYVQYPLKQLLDKYE